MSDNHIFLIDGSAYIFRAYHALPPLTRKSDGLPVGAVSGFCNMMWKLFNQAKDGELGPPATHFGVIFDYSSKTFRNEIYPDYKANRDAPPEDLRPQFGLIRKATQAFNMPCVEQEGFEADDLIATYARIANERGDKVTIVSSDKDLMQLVTNNVSMYDQMKDKHISIPEVHEKFGVGPEKMIDLQALAGDSTDNVPGVPGIGAKTAAQLLLEYGDLDTLLERAGEIKQNKRRENLIEFADQARISRELVKLDANMDLNVPLDDLGLIEVEGGKLLSFLKGMQFTSLTKRVAETFEADITAIDAEDIQVDGYEAQRGPDLDASGEAGSAPAGDWTPQSHATNRANQLNGLAVDHAEYQLITELDDLDQWCATARDRGYIAVDTETTSLDAMVADLVGVSLAFAPGHACYIPLAHKDAEEVSGDLFGGPSGDTGGELTGPDGKPVKQLAMSDVMPRLKALFEDPSVLKIAQNLKYDWLVLSRYDIEVAPFDDTMLLSYALDAGVSGGHGMDALSQRWLDHSPIPFKDVCGSGKSQITFDKVPLDKALAYAAEDADVTLRLWMLLKPRLAAENMTVVYERLERQMVPTLARMAQTAGRNSI